MCESDIHKKINVYVRVRELEKLGAYTIRGWEFKKEENNINNYKKTSLTRDLYANMRLHLALNANSSGSTNTDPQVQWKVVGEYLIHAFLNLGINSS